ncbi:hypothetical protein BDV98DRAFT_205002 [Pterulicium gracile]|uniref:Uncharacterized protein n=1 Tax=Pterulicium gracile TaxID=1884261 RepID=A0A5C3Q8T7_9AGAR|nr:hypothetical protein BDV98DRAFT_205002 [Pterula gracilis]
MDVNAVQVCDEVLHHIFAIVSQDNQRLPTLDDEKILTLGSRGFPHLGAQEPWNIAAVCKSFRRIACESPSLWTNVELCTGPCGIVTVTSCHHDLHLTRCQLQLQRSWNLPLTVFLHRGPICPRLESVI